MQIGRSGYYAWKQRKPGDRSREDELMKRIIQPVFSESQNTYGSRRLKASLKRAGISTSRRRISRLMKEEGMVPKQVNKWHPQTTQADERHEKAPNILNQDFSYCDQRRLAVFGSDPGPVFKDYCRLVNAKKNDKIFSYGSLENGLCLETSTERNAASQRSG